ncbi:MAG TPA: hypothetical protein VGH23_09380 [Rhizomicrobium sp.]|jgi:hypothetical protein
MAEEEFEDEPPPPPSPSHGFEHFVRENPTAAMVGAVVVGILLGRLVIL